MPRAPPSPVSRAVEQKYQQSITGGVGGRQVMDIVLGGTNKATPRHNYQVLFYCMKFECMFDLRADYMY